MSYFRFFFFSSRRRHTRCLSDWSSDVCSSDLVVECSRDRGPWLGVCPDQGFFLGAGEGNRTLIASLGIAQGTGPGADDCLVGSVGCGPAAHDVGWATGPWMAPLCGAGAGPELHGEGDVQGVGE